MANPQKENGFLAVANEIVEALCQVQLSGTEQRLLWAIWRKTWGWQKKSDSIPIRRLKEMTNMKERLVWRGLAGLVLKNIVFKKLKKDPASGLMFNVFTFNKDYDSWRPPPDKIVSPPLTKLSAVKNVRNPLTKLSYSNKETIKTKKTLCPEFFSLVDLLSEKMQENDPGAKVPKAEPQWEKWANDFRLLVKRDGRPIEEVKKVLAWSQADSFWKGVVLSAPKFREKYPQLKLRMEEQEKKSGTKKMTAEEFDEIQEAALRRND